MSDTEQAVDTPQVLAAAEALGGLIAAHSATRALESLVGEIEADTDAQRLATDLDRHRRALAEKEQQGKPIEVDEKRRLQELQQEVAMHPKLSRLQLVQMDYVDLMRRVDERIASAGGTPTPANG
ncbi:MAG: YlbF family regulator [Planctomycetota bacterium]